MTAPHGMRAVVPALVLSSGLAGSVWGRPARALERRRSRIEANHGSPEGALHESSLLHRWQRQGDLFDGVSYLEQPPGLGNERLDPAPGLHGVCEDAYNA